jgi:riboflavin synthase
MFTGIIKTVGEINSIKNIQNDIEISIHFSGIDNLELGDSICVNGACLTISNFLENKVIFHLSKETLSKITGLTIGEKINIEDSLRVGDKLGGHYVSGHVDGMLEILEIHKESACEIWSLSLNKDFKRFIAPKGSIALNGVSLTVNQVYENSFTVNLIPHTINNTNFKYRKPGDKLNFEVDLLARYILNRN